MDEYKKIEIAAKRVSWKKLMKTRNPAWLKIINNVEEDKQSNSGYMHIYKCGEKEKPDLKEYIEKSQLAEYKKQGWKTGEESIRDYFKNMAKGLMEENKSNAKDTLKFMYNSGLFMSKAERIAALIKPDLKALGMGRNKEGQLNYDPTKRKGTFTSISDIEYIGAVEYENNSGTLYSFKSGNKTLWYFTANSPKSENYQSRILAQDPR